MPDKLKRRSFLRTLSLSTMAMLPVTNVLGGLIDYEGEAYNGNEEPSYIDHAVRLLQYESLLYLECYFLNVHRTKDNHLIPLRLSKAPGQAAEDDKDAELKSYMVVRLPQQHIAEQFFDVQALWKLAGKKVYANTAISGYSYLVFEINFKKISGNRLPLTISSLLNWNAPFFELVVKESPKDCIFNVRKNGSRNLAEPRVNYYPLGTKPVATGRRFDRNYFPKYAPSRYTKPGARPTISETEFYLETDKYLLSDPGPVTAIEAPYRLILSPKLPDKDAYKFVWSFSYPANEKNENFSAELWMATLKIRKKFLHHIPNDPKAELDKKMHNQGDNQMELMMIGSPDYSDAASTEFYEAEKCSFSRLPCSLDRQDLVFLYIHGGIPARALSLTFTPLGISTSINFRNHAFEKNNNPLFQWDHEISFGRDQKVTISRIVVEATCGLKMLHIQSTNRETFKEQSILIYREFLMPLDIEKDFSLYVNNENINEYKDPNWKFNQPLKKVGFKEIKPIEIKPLLRLSDNLKITAKVHVKDPARDQNPSKNCDCVNEKDGEQIVAFWPVRLDGRYVNWEMFFNDWQSEDNRAVQAEGEAEKKEQGDDRTNFTKRLFILTSDLCKDENLELLYTDKEHPVPVTLPAITQEIFKPVTEDDLTDFEGFVTRINVEIEKKCQSNTWMQILRLSEDFELQKTDHYRLYLENSMALIEQRLRAKARNIEDQVVEEWNILKRRMMNAERDILSIVSRFISHIENEITSFEAIIPRLSDADKLINAAIIKLLNEYKARVLDKKVAIVREIEVNFAAALSRIGAYKDDIISILREYNIKLNNPSHLPFLREYFSQYRDKLQTFEKYLEEFSKIEMIADSLGFEWAFQAFAAKLPRGYINVVKRDIGKYLQSLQKCVNAIQHIEENLVGRVDLYKAKVGYAVNHVEDELKELKAELKERFKDKEEEFKQEYERLRAKYHKEVNEKISKLETEYIIFRNNFRHLQKDFNEHRNEAQQKIKQVFNFYHEYSCFPQMFTSKVNGFKDLLNKDIAMKIKYPEDYFKNQVSNKVLETTQNAAKVFAELKADAKEMVKGALREIGNELGGFVNPELAADFLTYAKDVKADAEKFRADIEAIVNGAKDAGREFLENVNKEAAVYKREFEGELNNYKDQLTQAKNSLMMLSNDAKEALKTKENEAKAYFKHLEAKIIGAIHLRDIIGAKAMLPRLERRGDKIVYTFITKDLVMPPVNKLFSFMPMLGTESSSLIIHMEKSVKNVSEYVAWTRLSNFEVGVFEQRIILGVEKLEIRSDNNVKNKVSVNIRSVDFQKELAFIKALAQKIQSPGSGFKIDINPQEISVDFRYALPDISGGAFNFFNVKFGVGVIIPFPIGSKKAVSPIIAKFGINSADDKFVLGIGIWGGRGHAVVEATPKFIRSVDVGMDYGGLLALNLGIARGQAYLMAGVRYVYKRDDFGESTMELYALITCGGSVTVFGFITISVVFVLSLKYERKSSGPSSMYGTCSVSYSVEIGFFKKSFTLSFSKRLHGSDSQGGSEDYGYIPYEDIPNDNNSGLVASFWRAPEDDENGDSMYHYAQRKGNNNEMKDEYDFGKEKLTSRYTQGEWRKICRIHKIKSV